MSLVDKCWLILMETAVQSIFCGYKWKVWLVVVIVCYYLWGTSERAVWMNELTSAECASWHRFMTNVSTFWRAWAWSQEPSLSKQLCRLIRHLLQSYISISSKTKPWPGRCRFWKVIHVESWDAKRVLFIFGYQSLTFYWYQLIVSYKLKWFLSTSSSFKSQLLIHFWRNNTTQRDFYLSMRFPLISSSSASHTRTLVSRIVIEIIHICNTLLQLIR